MNFVRFIMLTLSLFVIIHAQNQETIKVHEDVNNALQGNYILVGTLLDKTKPDLKFMQYIQKNSLNLNIISKYLPNQKREYMMLLIGGYGELSLAQSALENVKKNLVKDPRHLREYFYKYYNWENSKLIEKPKYFIQVGIYPLNTPPTDIIEKISQANLPYLKIDQHNIENKKLHEIILVGDYKSQEEAESILQKVQEIVPTATILSQTPPTLTPPTPEPNEVEVTVEYFQEAMRLYNYSDYVGALENFKLALNQGESMSDYYIGHIYAMGKSVPRDLIQAKLYLDKAVANNIPEAMYQRGLIAIEEKETTKGLMLLDQSAQMYYKPAIKQLGVIYYQGETIPKEIEKAVVYLKLGSGQNIQLSQYMLGLLYITGEGVIQDNYQAAKLLKKAIRGEDEAIAGKAQRIYQKYGLGNL